MPDQESPRPPEITSPKPEPPRPAVESQTRPDWEGYRPEILSAVLDS